MSFLPDPIGTDARASAIFRKTDAGWRLITWAESPGSPILYIQRLYKLHREDGEASPMPLYLEAVRAPHATGFRGVHGDAFEADGRLRIVESAPIPRPDIVCPEHTHNHELRGSATFGKK